ncbi:MAG: rRNA maturation RNase YbeY [Parachlamydia sp.]|nr:rRNA maturation RNase YbeY [Parachlamydia sp.]
MVAALVREAVAFERVSGSEVAIHLIGTKAMSRLHELYFQDPSLTDCISFPLDDEVLGDVFVCPQVARAYVLQNGGDFGWETTLYIVHGLLHLMGYDDIREIDRKKMRAAEARHMRHLEKKRLVLKS